MRVMKMKAHITDIAFFKIWLNEKKILAESSITVYLETAKHFLISNPDVDKIEEYNDFLIKHSIKKRTYHHYSALKAFIEFKILDANVKHKLIEQMIRPPIRNDIVMERKYLKEDVILEVINNLKEPKHRVISIIQTLTGIRSGDILRLKRDNILSEEYNGRPVIRLNITGKGKKRNVIYIHDEIAQQIIMDYISTTYNHDEYYFIELGKMKNRRGNTKSEYKLLRMNYSWFWMDLKQALKNTGIDYKDFATHDFRRCFARRVWEKYKDVHVLQGLLNHSNPATTMRYLDQSGLKNIDYHYDMQMNNTKS